MDAANNTISVGGSDSNSASEQELEAQPLSELLVQVLEREELETLKAEMVFWLEEEQTLSEAKDFVSEALSLLVRLPLDWVLEEVQ